MEFSAHNAKQIGLFFLISFAVQLAFFVILYLLLRKKFQDAKYRILTVGATLGNVGFFGLPVLTALFPQEPLVSCYSSVYVMSMNLLVFTIGVFMITGERKYMSIKSAILNPTTLAILFSLPFFFFNVHFPAVVEAPISLLGKMSTPLCMLVLGMRLASMPFRNLISRPFAYISSALKLIVFPLFAYLCVVFLPFLDEIFKQCVLILSAAPTGAVVLSLSELHECEQDLSANVLVMSTILSVLTLPLIVLIV